MKETIFKGVMNDLTTANWCSCHSPTRGERCTAAFHRWPVEECKNRKERRKEKSRKLELKEDRKAWRELGKKLKAERLHNKHYVK